MNEGIQLSLFGQDNLGVRHLQDRHGHQGPGRRQHRARRHLTDDHFPDKRFDYGLSNPPFGVG